METRSPKFRHAGFFSMRTPLLTFGEFLGWNDNATDLDTLRARLAVSNQLASDLLRQLRATT